MENQGKFFCLYCLFAFFVHKQPFVGNDRADRFEGDLDRLVLQAADQKAGAVSMRGC